MTSTILFDLGGVVVPLTAERAFDKFRALGVDPDRWLGLYGQKGIFHDVETGKVNDMEFISELERMTGHSYSYGEVAEAWRSFVGPVPEERIALLRELRKNYRLCLASNTNPFIMDWMRSPAFFRGESIDRFFDSQYCSYETGEYKPDAAFFEKILDAEGITPHEALFIDDSRRNIDGAASVGIPGLLADAGWEKRLLSEVE